MGLKAITALVVGLALAGPAAGQLGPPGIDKDSTLVEDLIVRAFGGPPWWKVSSATSTVYIMADPGPLPEGVTFDRSGLNHRLDGANQLILPSTIELDLGPLLRAPAINRVMAAMGPEPGGAVAQASAPKRPPPAQAWTEVFDNPLRLEATLAPDMRARFIQLRERIHQPESRYAHLPPALAGMALAGDATWPLVPADGPNQTSLVDVAVQLAYYQSVSSAPAKTYRVEVMDTLVEEMAGLDKACMAEALASVDAPRLAAPPQDIQLRDARAWAEGDLHPLIETWRAFPRDPAARLDINARGSALHLLAPAGCLAAMKRTRALSDHWSTEEAAAIAQALRRRGHSVAVLDAANLLVQGGVLDILRKQGYTVVPPGS